MRGHIMMTLTPEKVMTKPHAKNQDYRSSDSGQKLENPFIGAHKKKEKEEKDNQYKLNRQMAYRHRLNENPAIQYTSKSHGEIL